MDPLVLFGRTDKAVLAGGDGIAFAPARDQDTAGFWDGAVVLGRAVTPLFAVTILDQHGAELVPRVSSRRWSPSALVTEYRFAHGIQAIEVRTVHPGGVFVSEWRLSAVQPVPLHLIAWTAFERSALQGSLIYDGAMTFTRSAGDGAVACALAAVGGATSWAAYASDGALGAPSWRLTPFLEHWRSDGLPRDTIPGVAATGRCFAAVHRALAVSRAGTAVTFAMRAIPAEPNLQPSAATQSAAPPTGTFESASARRWETRFAALPTLRTSDPYVERAYWYRWYGAWLLRVEPGTGLFADGGAGAHGSAIGVADAALTPALVRDLRWHPDPSWARGALFQILSQQFSDGSLPRTVCATSASTAHAPPTIDWGGALSAFAVAEPDDAYVARAWHSLERYARWLYATHDADDTGLIDLHHPDETDGAASPRFLASSRTRKRGRSAHAELRLLKGVDATAYGFALCKSLARLAPRAGAAGSEWSERAERIAAAVQASLWDEELGFFCDFDATFGRRIRMRSAAGFAPLAVGLAWPEQTARIAESLLDRARFWTPFPVPSLAADEPGFDPLGEWEGSRVSIACNGRMWPADTALVIDALAAAEPDGDGPLRTAAAQLLKRLIRAHFHDGDIHAAAAFENYNPLTGHPSVFRAVDDCHAGRLVDLIVRHGAGVHPGSRAVRVDPLPLGLESLSLAGLRVHGKTIDIAIAQNRVVATVDGVEHQTTIGTPKRIVFGERS